jgi:hypothetical protein
MRHGTGFTVQVTTYGNGCYRKGETEVAVSGNVATVTPWDYVDLGAGACPDILLTFVHEATVAFPEAGSASVVKTSGKRWRIARAAAPGPPSSLWRRTNAMSYQSFGSRRSRAAAIFASK